MTTPAHPKDKIIVPLDFPSEAAALRMIEQLGDAVTFYKVGLELFVRCGPEAVRRIRAAIKAANGDRGRLFLDLKFHDIPNTVAGAVRSASALEADMLTIHLSGGRAMVRAAAAETPAGTLLLGVSVMTSIDEATLRETGVPDPVDTQVLRLARLGHECGLHGVVASPHEISSLRAGFGRALTIVTPGVRPAWASGDDQRRVMTPGEALKAGADYLVIGRPITASSDPRAAAQRVAEEMAGTRSVLRVKAVPGRSPGLSGRSPALPPPLAELVVIDDSTPHPAALNMAVDEVLLNALEGTALLRCYRWSRAAVSFGCFGKIAAIRTDYPNAEWVRRWTGGGIVEHGHDFTYTLLIPRALPLAGMPASESYRLIHSAVAAALAAAGWPQVEAAGPFDDRLPSARPPDGVGAAPFLKPCFVHPVPYDLLAAGRKIAGGAQRRTRRGLLHQGSIQGSPFGNSPGEGSWRGLPEKLAAALAAKFVHRPLSTATVDAANLLAARKYGARSWTERF